MFCAASPIVLSEPSTYSLYDFFAATRAIVTNTMLAVFKEPLQMLSMLLLDNS